MRATCIFITLLTSCCFSVSATAEVFRWTDSNGQVHYSDQAPKAIHSETKTVATPLLGNGSGPDYGVDLDKPKKRKIPRRLKSLPKKDPALCVRSKTSLEILSAGGRVRGSAADGSVTYLTPDEIAEQIKFAKQTIDVHCDE